MRRQIPIWIFVSTLMVSGCGKKTIRVDTPVALREAQVATPEELVRMVNERYAGFESVTVSQFKIDFVSGSVEKGYLEEYPSAKGHLVAKRPGSVYMNILNPLTSSTVVTMASTEGKFQVWVPRENKFITGLTSIRPAETENPLYSVRPDHLLSAVLIEPIANGDTGLRYFVEEEQSARQKFYVFSLFDTSVSGPACLSRKIWIERHDLQLARQHYYDCGKLLSVINYGSSFEVEGKLLARSVDVDRIREHYRLKLQWESGAIRLDRLLKDSAFDIPRPPGAELIEVTGGTDSPLTGAIDAGRQ